METFTHDPDRDPALSGALRDAYGPVPAIDFARLRGAVMDQAELPLARARRSRPAPFGGRFRSLVPLAAAAGIAGTALALSFHSPAATHGGRGVSQADRQQVEQILNESVPDVSDLVSGQTGSEELLNGAIGS
jgi:hypothetical protein